MSVGVCVLGATGSIGVNTLDVIARNPDRYHVVALTAHRNREKLLAQCLQFRPSFVVLDLPADAQWLTQQLLQRQIKTQVLSGEQALAEVAALAEVQVVMAAIVGAAGLLPVLAAIKARKRILLANKECLVMAGALVMAEVARCGAELLPVDSEHNALFQCMPAGYQIGTCPAGVDKIILTASGGAFRDLPLAELAAVTPEQACQHPNWSMGRKITVDCATMMNKGLEVIEAFWLFALPLAKIEVVVHPQSVVHSFTQYMDGSTLAQLSLPDMRTPIAHALAWPDRISAGVQTLDWQRMSELTFKPIDWARYRCLGLAYEALKAGGCAPAHLNAANEVAVAAFLAGQIGFMQIAEVNEFVLNKLANASLVSLTQILAQDQLARTCAADYINGLQHSEMAASGVAF